MPVVIMGGSRFLVGSVVFFCVGVALGRTHDDDEHEGNMSGQTLPQKLRKHVGRVEGRRGLADVCVLLVV